MKNMNYLSRFLSTNKETRFLMECEKKIKDLGSERQKVRYIKSIH